MSQSDQDDYWNGRAGLPTHGAYGEMGRRDVEEERRARDEAIQRVIARPAKSAPKETPRRVEPAAAPATEPSGGTLAGLITLAAAIGFGAMAYNATHEFWAGAVAAVAAGFVASKIWKLIVVVAIIAALAMVFG